MREQLRRWHVALVAAIWVASLAGSHACLAQTQPVQLKRVGVLWSGTADTTAAYWGAFVQGMQSLGWIEGKTANFIIRFDDNDKSRLPRLAAELVALKVDVMAVTSVATPAARAATKSIPIVYLDAFDPIAEGFTPTLARSVGNITGISWQSTETAIKRLELARELVPRLRRLGMVHDPADPISVLELSSYRKALAGTDVEIRAFEVRRAHDFAKAFTAIKAYRPQALIYPTLVLSAEKLAEMVHFASSIKLPTLSEAGQFAEAGILLSYGVDYVYAYKRAAIQVDRVLKGAKPSELPWEQVDKFDLVVNMKTTRAIGLTIPQSIRTHATRVIE